MATTRRFAANFLWDITNGEIHWVCRLVAKHSDLRFVRRDDNWNNGPTWTMLIKFFLARHYKLRSPIDVTSSAYLCVPPPLSGMHVMKQTHSLIFVSVVALGGKCKVFCEVGIAVQRLDAFEDVAVIHIE